MSISKTGTTTPRFQTTQTDAPRKITAPKPTKADAAQNTFATSSPSPTAQTKRPGLTRSISATTAAPASRLPFTPNATAVQRAEQTSIGKAAATEIPKYAHIYNKASELTGVPPEMIAAIHGNESQFGKYTKSSKGPESGFGLDPRYVKSGWANEQLAKHGLGSWERGTGSEKSVMQSAVVAAEHFKRNAGYAGIKVGPNMSQGDIAGAVTSYISGPGKGKSAKASGKSWVFNPNDSNPHPLHPGGTSITPKGKVRVKPGRKTGLLRWDSLLPLAQKHLGKASGQPTQLPGQAAGQLTPQASQMPPQAAQLPGQAAQQLTPQAPQVPPQAAQLPGQAAQQLTPQAPQTPTQAAQLPGQAAQQLTPQAPANTGLAQTAAQNGLQTNQDLINHCYKQGGGDWAGAQQIARQLGVDLNDLVRDRQGAIGGSTQPALSGPAGNLAQQTGAQTNQDLINQLYQLGGGNWQGASQKANEMGLDLGQLARNRQASVRPGGATQAPTAGATQSAPGGVTPSPTGGAEAPSPTGGAEAPTPAAPGGGDFANRLLGVARNELAHGVRENAGSNEDRAGHILKYRNAVTAPGYRKNRGPEAWCADFVSYAFKQAGKPLGPNGKGFASVSMMKNWLNQNGNFHRSGPKVGDIAFFKNFSHVAIIEKINNDGTVTTIEGNTGGPGGQGLHRKTRRLSGISGFGRP